MNEVENFAPDDESTVIQVSLRWLEYIMGK